MITNPNGESLVMDLPVGPGLGSPVKPFSNYPIKDRPQNM